MKKVIVLISIIVTGVVHAQLFPKLGDQRAGISALTFLKNDLSPMSSALANASISSGFDGMAQFRNAALIVENQSASVAVSHQVLPGNLQQPSLSVRLPHDSLGCFAFGITNISTGAMEVRTEFQPNGTGEYFYANNLSANLSYARILTEQFSFGATIKYINEKLDYFSNHSMAVDIGFLYKTDYRDLHFAVVLQNFGPNTEAKGDFQYSGVSDIENKEVTLFPMPTVFKMGFSLDVLEKASHHIRVSAQLNHPNDNAENLGFGIEYNYLEWLYLRSGIKINVADQPYPTFGIGTKTRFGRHPIKIDYTVVPTKFVGLIHSAALSLSINNQSRDEN